QAEARNDNHLAQKIRVEKVAVDAKIVEFVAKRDKLVEEAGGLKSRLATNHKLLSEAEKMIKLEETDGKKHIVIENLLAKINQIIKEIKEDKKYSLQKSLLLGLKKIMHKEDFIANVRVQVLDDVMDIDLLDKNGQI